MIANIALEDGSHFSYAYDDADRLTGESRSQIAPREYETTCAYDGAGNRTPEDAGQVRETNDMMYDGVHMAAAVMTSGTFVRAYTHGPGIDHGPAMTVYTGATVHACFHLTDHPGTVHALADMNGVMVETYRYDAWSLACWLSRDPIGDIAAKRLIAAPISEAGGEHLYGFVRNAPVIGVDVLGLFLPPPTIIEDCPCSSLVSGKPTFSATHTITGNGNTLTFTMSNVMQTGGGWYGDLKMFWRTCFERDYVEGAVLTRSYNPGHISTPTPAQVGVGHSQPWASGAGLALSDRVTFLWCDPAYGVWTRDWAVPDGRMPTVEAVNTSFLGMRATWRWSIQ